MLDLTQSRSGFSDQLWWELAACRTSNPEVFFDKQHEQVAKAMCRTCSVRGDCLLDALPDLRRSGVAGGLSERERRKLRRLSAA